MPPVKPSTWPRRATTNLLLLTAAAVAAAASPSQSQSHAPILSTGLQNLGNTCYLNAQLQCAYHIPRVRNIVISGPTEIERPSPGLQAFRSVFLDMLQASQLQQPKGKKRVSSGTGFVVSPLILAQVLGINVMEQQDSQEFWKLLLPELKREALTDLYQGTLENYLIALDGSGRQKTRPELFLDLSLAVQPEESGGADAYSVEEALESIFGAPEVLRCSEGNGWRPAKGEDKVDAHKGSRIHSSGLPSILQLHLKRFHYDWSTPVPSMQKMNNPVLFPKTLDMSSILMKDDKDNGKTSAAQEKQKEDAEYDLQAVVIHTGEYERGHYYAYVRPEVPLPCGKSKKMEDEGEETWYRFNDHQVAPVTYRDVVEDATGGKVAVIDGKASLLDVQRSTQKKGGFLARIFGRCSSSSSLSSGFGGRTSSAYVLQYVRRRDIPMLYQEE